MKKKIIACITGLAIVAMIIPSSAQAVTAAELQDQIDDLMATLSDLQSQLADLTGEPTGGVGVSCTFTRSLYPGISGADVKCLQEYLNDAGYTVAASSYGSPGNETEYYGSLTKAAVGAWQDGNGVEYGAWKGYFGPISQAKYDALAAAGEQEEEEEEEEEEAGALSVKLESDTPESDTVADAANANFTKFSLKASSDGDVSISKIYITRTGLSANSDVENIKIIDVETGAYKGNIGSLNTNNEAMISFVPKLVIRAGEKKEFYIRAGVKDGASAGKTIKLGIAEADDIVSDAGSVSGNFPITGNAMTVVVLTIGSLTVSEDGTTIDSKPDAGDTGVIVLKWKGTAGSTEPVTINTVTVMRKGTADATDTENIELYSTTDDKSLGIQANWDSEDKATWDDLDIEIAKGKSHRFKIMLDVIGGVESTAQTVNVDMVDASDVLVVVTGNTYGFYITPGDSSGANWRNTTVYRGLGYYNQTIQAGSLVVTKSASTPSAGNIAPGDDIVLAVFDFEAKGEEIKITTLNLFASTSGSMTYSDVTNVALYDEDGTIVCGPGDIVVTDNTVDFTDTFIVPVGIHEYTVKATIADSADTGNAIAIAIEDVQDLIAAEGMTSGDTITPSPDGNVTANTMTVAAGALTVTTLASPASRYIPSPVDEFIWATFSLDASSSGEDVDVTTITVTDCPSGATGGGDIDSAELWADLTSANSSRGDVYETKISDTEQWDGADTTSDTEAYTLNQTLTIPKTSWKKIALVADLASSVTGAHSFYITTAGVTSAGAETGETITASYVTANKQTLTVASAALNTSKDSSSPKADIIIGGTDGVSLGVFRLAATNVEDLELDSITLGATNGEYISTYYFYHGSDLLGTLPGGNNVTFVIPVDDTLIIPANDHEEITIKGDLNKVDGTTISDDDAVKIALYEVQTTGKGSGSPVDDGSNVDANTMQIYESRPYFSKNSASPAGDLTSLGSSTNIAIFDVSAHENEDITFDRDDSNILRMKVNAQVTDTATNFITFTIKDDEGNLLGTDSITIGNLGVNSGTLITFDSTNSFGSVYAANTWTIAADQTEKLYVNANTSNFEDDGDYIQVWFDDDDNNRCMFGIDGTGTHEEGVYIFRNEIYGGTLVNPS